MDINVKQVTIHLTHPVNGKYQYQLSDVIISFKETEIIISADEGDVVVSHIFDRTYIISMELIKDKLNVENSNRNRFLFKN